MPRSITLWHKLPDSSTKNYVSSEILSLNQIKTDKLKTTKQKVGLADLFRACNLNTGPL